MHWCPHLGVTEVRGWWAPRYKDVLRAAVQQLSPEALDPCQLQAEVAPVLEPLKVRLISKGNALPYWAASPFQRRMWQHLVALPEFALIGQPFDASHLEGVMLREKELGVAFPSWVSGDYAAATDGLSQEVNRLALDAALARLGATEDEKRLCRAVLGNHLLTYPPKFVERAADQRQVDPGLESLDPVEQRNGQLMGSPLSFPILCAINVVAYKLALEEYLEREVPWGSLPVLVNGDDILFRADDRLYGIWQRYVAQAGFTLSLGKNYISPTLLSVNSQYYMVTNQGPWQATFRQVGYLHTGLLFSDASAPFKPGTRPENLEMTWTDKASALLELCNDPERTMRRVKHYYRDVIKRDTGSGELNLFIPPALGGLGVSSRGQTETDYQTSFQKNLCRFLRSEFEGLDTVETRESDATWEDRVGWVLPRKNPWAVRIRDPVVQVRVRAPFEPLQQGEREPEDGLKSLHPVQYPPPDCPSRRSWRFRWVSADRLRKFRSLPTGSFHGSCEPWVPRIVVRDPGGAN
jgi:hypothetical protein